MAEHFERLPRGVVVPRICRIPRLPVILDGPRQRVTLRYLFRHRLDVPLCACDEFVKSENFGGRPVDVAPE